MSIAAQKAAYEESLERAEMLAGLRAQRPWYEKLGNLAVAKPLGTVSLVIIVAMWIIAIGAPVIAPYDWNQILVKPRFTPPSPGTWLGTDELGRDVLSRLIWASRLSLSLSVFSVTIGTMGGTLIGLASGYFMGVFDLTVQRITDAYNAIPQLLFLIAITSVLGTNILPVFIALTILRIPGGGRLIRSVVLSARENVYVEAAKAIGAGDARIMFKHVFPNAYAPLIILLSIGLGANLLSQSSLSFLGLVSSVYPDWGGMLNAGARRYIERMPWMALAPGVVITLAVLSYNMLGDALRDILDPRLRGSRAGGARGRGAGRG
ncbi:MAG TPA: ABC transporter permease [Dehalococcoidia bacterium]|nr:ABC transporter permease [Dehalococcoidia bacterium]